MVQPIQLGYPTGSNELVVSTSSNKSDNPTGRIIQNWPAGPCESALADSHWPDNPTGPN